MITLLEWLITIFGVTSTFLTGRNLIISWPIGIISQLIWIAVATATSQWAFLPASCLYIALGAIGWRRWAHERKRTLYDATREHPAPIPVDGCNCRDGRMDR